MPHPLWGNHLAREGRLARASAPLLMHNHYITVQILFPAMTRARAYMSLMSSDGVQKMLTRPPKNKLLGKAALPGPLAFPFPPSRLLSPAELCARCLGPLVSHLEPSDHCRSSSQ